MTIADIVAGLGLTEAEAAALRRDVQLCRVSWVLCVQWDQDTEGDDEASD